MSITRLKRSARTFQWPWATADLVIADPPWTYSQSFSGSKADDHYRCMTTDDIIRAIDRIPANRLALWMTAPLMDEFIRRTQRWSWGRIRTVGTWVKCREDNGGHYGPGYHWAGCAEFVLIYCRQPKSYCNRKMTLRSAWIEPPTGHSVKPIGWQTQMIRRWVPPAIGRVLDPFAGSGSVETAVRQAGAKRSYLGLDIRGRRSC